MEKQMTLKEFLLTYHPGSQIVPKELDKKWLEAGNTRRDAERYVEGFNKCHEIFMDFIRGACKEYE